MWPEFRVVRRIQVQERAAFRWHLALEGAAMNGLDSLLAASRCAVGVNLNRTQMSACVLCDFQECAAVASAWVDGLVRAAKNE